MRIFQYVQHDFKRVNMATAKYYKLDKLMDRTEMASF